MTEREMLVFAAKAMGYWNILGQPCPWVGESWNPRTSDSDSRRIEVKLCIHLEYNKHPIDKSATLVQASPMGYGHLAVVEKIGDDPCDAVRLAVLKVAAAIGEQMS